MADTVINLEAQVVENQTDQAKRLRKDNDGEKTQRLRRYIRRLRLEPRSHPPRPYLIFMKDFRTTFYEENHDFNFHDYSTQGANRWKSLTEEEKNLYRDIAAELEAMYNNKPQLERDDFVILEVEDVVEKQAHEENVKKTQGKEVIILDDY